jgi:acetyl esterase/lipase
MHRSARRALRIHYGPDRAQFGELYRPAGGDRSGTVVVIHGGFWRARYAAPLGRPLAADLAAHGFTAWNIEYRRVGNGGGWPETLSDVAAAIDHLAEMDVDSSRVVTVGHSAGGHLAVWALGRPLLPAGVPGADPAVRVTAAVSQAGVLDLGTAAREEVGGTAVPDLLGGAPGDVPERYAVADPMRRIPLSQPVLCVHSRADESVPYAQSEAYVAAARSAGAPAALQEVTGDHMAVIDPATPAWTTVRESLPDLFAGRLPAVVS